jgi:hypothetical protein
MKDIMKSLEMLVRIPPAYNLIPLPEKLHMKTKGIGGTTPETVVFGEFGIRIFKSGHVNGKFNSLKYLNHFNFGCPWYALKNISASIS